VAPPTAATAIAQVRAVRVPCRGVRGVIWSSSDVPAVTNAIAEFIFIETSPGSTDVSTAL
jgi:hypothetical protein